MCNHYQNVRFGIRKYEMFIKKNFLNCIILRNIPVL